MTAKPKIVAVRGETYAEEAKAVVRIPQERDRDLINVIREEGSSWQWRWRVGMYRATQKRFSPSLRDSALMLGGRIHAT